MAKKINKFMIDIINDIPDDEDTDFAICRIEGLSDGDNSHGYIIPTEVLKRDAKTCLGKFIVAKIERNFIFGTDFSGHETDEIIIGYIPQDAKITFTENSSNNGIFFSVQAVISKLYSNGAIDIFKKDSKKAVSCEFTSILDPDNDKLVLSFNIRGITVLGAYIDPSCVGSNIEITKFSKDQANKFYHNKIGTLNELKLFAKGRKIHMAETKYKVDKSKDAMSDTSWGDVNKSELRKKVMDASNRDSLVKDVYMVVEDGWEEAPSEHLKYPVMELKGDTFVYNRHGISSALGYAKAEEDSTLVSKIEKIYKKLELNNDDQEGGKKMSKKVEKFAVNLDNLWSVLYTKLEERYPDKDYGSIYRMEGIYEESNKKFVVIFRKGESQLYKLGFNYTEEGLFLDEEMIETTQEFTDGETALKFAASKECEKYTKFDDDCEGDEGNDGEEGKTKMSSDANVDMAAMVEMLNLEAEKNKKLATTLEEKDNIIMRYETELADLKKFQTDTLEKEKTTVLSNLFANIKDKVSKEDYEKYETEGNACKFEDLTGWKNGVLAKLVESSFQFNTFSDGHLRMPMSELEVKEKSLWERL